VRTVRPRGAPFEIVAMGGVLLLGACVSERAGYEDVRRVTAERLDAEVRWNEEGENADPDVRKLLAEPLDVERAVRVALLNNREVQAAFETLGIARAEWAHALRLPNPTVAAALRYGAEERPEVDLEASINLTDLLFLSSRSGVGESGLDRAKLEVVGNVIDLAFETRTAFFAAQAAEQRLVLLRSILGALQASSEMANELHRAGNITAIEWRSQEAAFQEARVNLARAESAAQQARELLNGQLGLSGEAAGKWTLAPALPSPTPTLDLAKDVERRAISRSVDLELSKRRYQSAAKRVNLSRFEGWFPEIHAGVAAERGEGDFAVGPLAEVEVPLFYQGQGETAGALAEMRREAELARAVAVRVRARARALVARLQASEQAVAFYGEVLLPLRKQIVEDTQLQYNAMNAGVFQLLTAKRDEIATMSAHVDALLEYWTVRTELERLLAGRSSGGGMAVSPSGAATTRAAEAAH
jgi:cobalt-zinc-cadmium efflux system outer membrane protein